MKCACVACYVLIMPRASGHKYVRNWLMICSCVNYIQCKVNADYNVRGTFVVTLAKGGFPGSPLDLPLLHTHSPLLAVYPISASQRMRDMMVMTTATVNNILYHNFTIAALETAHIP